MGLGTIIHHVGTLLLLASTVLLIVVSVSSPVVNNLSLMRVDLGASAAGDRITFGSFGYCILDFHGHDACTHSHVGYEPTDVLSRVTGVSFSRGDHDSTRIVTRLFVLHPVAAGLSFLAFLLCLGTGIVGALAGSILSFLAFVVALIALAGDFAVFAILKHAVNSRARGGASAHWGEAVWCVVAAAAASLVASLLVLVTCCAGRRKNRRKSATGV